ncbi:MAG: hypothetical protein JXN60_09045 [Lentisphaerae bacterium]|nr:hypothetical protein [Lentisphaerota bacterium]
MRKMLLSICVTAIMAAVIMTSGCDTDSSYAPVKITPSSATIVRMGSVEFTASGGYDYTWDLEDDSLGILSDVTGEKTRYTSLYDPGASIKIQVVKVTSTIEDASTSSAYTATAEAYVSHISTEQLMYITPATATVKAGDKVDFTVSGGSSYTWYLQDDSYGILSTTNGSSTTYTSLVSPDESQVFLQVLTVVSSSGDTATALITHEWQYN